MNNRAQHTQNQTPKFHNDKLESFDTKMLEQINLTTDYGRKSHEPQIVVEGLDDNSRKQSYDQINVNQPNSYMLNPTISTTR